MHKSEFLAPLVKMAVTVLLTVAVCVGILLGLKPWQTHTREEHTTNTLSANIEAAEVIVPDLSVTEPKPEIVPTVAQVIAPKPATPPVARPAPIIAASKPASSQAITGAVSKPKAVAAVNPPLLSDQPPSSEISQEAKTTEVAEYSVKTGTNEQTSSETEEEQKTALDQLNEDPNVPTLPVRAPHRLEKQLKEKEKRAEEYSAPWKKAESTKALAPLLSYEISDNDIEALKQFVDLAYKEKFSKARKYRDKLKHPVARKFARWY